MNSPDAHRVILEQLHLGGVQLEMPSAPNGRFDALRRDPLERQQEAFQLEGGQRR